MYGPRQNLLRNEVITFSLNDFFRHSYSKNVRKRHINGRHCYFDVSMLSFERLTSLMFECRKLYMHHCLKKLKRMTTFDNATAQRTIINFCVEGGMTPIQTLKQMPCTDKYKNVSKQLVYKWHSRFRDGWTDSAPRG